MLNGKVVLISGGTGSFGKKFIETILYRYRKLDVNQALRWGQRK